MVKGKNKSGGRPRPARDPQKETSSPATLRSWAAKAALLFLGVLIPLAFFEMLIAATLHYPILGKGGLLRVARPIYEEQYRNIIQFESAAARYDPELTYLLRPGTFRFRNPEFDVEYRVNRAGLRDDEDALHQPEIIVLGDSEAMGWGVEQSETYAKIIERRSKRRVLNAAVSSYGTVREMRLLDRLDTAKLKYLIIHYMKNDDMENGFFYKNDNSLMISREDRYDGIVALYEKTKRYYPGKYIWLSLQFLREGAAGKAESTVTGSPPHDRAAIFFLNAVMNASHVDLKQVKIVVLVGADAPDFPPRLRKAIASGAYPAYIRNLEIITLGDILGRDDYFLLDEHLRSRGHERIAAELLKKITR